MWLLELFGDFYRAMHVVLARDCYHKSFVRPPVRLSVCPWRCCIVRVCWVTSKVIIRAFDWCQNQRPRIRDGNGSVGHGSQPVTHWPIMKQAVVRGTTNPDPCCQLANASDLFPLSCGRCIFLLGNPDFLLGRRNFAPISLSYRDPHFAVFWGRLWGNPFTRIDPKCNQVVPWSLHTFPENFTQIGPAVFS